MKDKSLLWWLIGVALIAGLGYLVLRQKSAMEGSDSTVGKEDSTTVEAPTFEGEVKIGAVLPLSGVMSELGNALLHAANLAVEQVNAVGGIGGKKVTLVVQDGKCDKAEAASVGEALAADAGIRALIGGGCSSETLGLASVTLEKNIVAVSPSSGAPSVTTDAGANIFRLYPSDTLVAKAAARYALNEFQAKKVSILFEETDEARDAQKAFRDAFAEFGGKVVLEEGYESDRVDFQAYAKKVKETRQDVLFLASRSVTSTIALLDALKKEGVTTRIIHGGLVLRARLTKEQAESLEGVIGFEPAFDETSDAVKTFAESYRTRFSEEVQYPLQQANAYSIVYLFKQLMEEKGMEADQLRRALDALREWKGGALTDVNLDQNGDIPWTMVQALTLRSGELVKVEQMEVK